MDSIAAYPLIAPLLEDLKDRGVQLTDKAIQCLNFAAVDAKRLKYGMLYDDNILTGVVRCSGTVTGLLESLGLDPFEVIERAHLPLVRAKEYRTQILTALDRKKLRRRRERPIRAIWDGGYSTAGSNQTSFVAKLPPNVTSEELFLLALDMPAVWEALNRRGFSVNKVRMHGRRLRLLEPDIETQKFLISLDGNKYRFDLFDFAAGARIESQPSKAGEIIPCRLEIVTPRTHDLSQQVEEFEWLINKAGIGEHDIQRFLEKHPHFLMGIEHKRIHPQLNLVRDDQPDLRPDFFMERIEGRWCDILDLKLPTERLVVGTPNRRTFGAGVISALGQLREYRNYFDDAANRRAFAASYDLEAYKPKVHVLIGRSNHFRSFEERRALQEEFSHLDIVTFDDVLLRVKHQIGLLR